MTILSYDNTIEGFFTAIFEMYEFKYTDVKIVNGNFIQSNFFAEPIQIITNVAKSERVLIKLEKLLGKTGIRKIFYTYLSEKEELEDCLLGVIRYAIENPKKNILSDYSNTHVLQLSKIVKSVGREKHRMEAFVRFELLKDELYFAKIYPDFNVLTLIATHFKNRYQDQKWIIYDFKRNYGIYYDLEHIEMITLPDYKKFLATDKNDLFDSKELFYQKLWVEYFDHTNIKERKNMKLHVQHVPKRYWKYLTEKKQF